MQYRDDWRLLRREGSIILRALFFSVVTAPAIVLFSVVMLHTLYGSLTGQFISEAESFTQNAPDGMVMVCREPDPALLQEAKIPPPSVYPEPCEKVPMSAKEYAAQSDSTLLFCWRVFAMLAFAFRLALWVGSESPSNLLSVISRKGKEITRCIRRK